MRGTAARRFSQSDTRRFVVLGLVLCIVTTLSMASGGAFFRPFCRTLVEASVIEGTSSFTSYVEISHFRSLGMTTIVYGYRFGQPAEFDPPKKLPHWTDVHNVFKFKLPLDWNRSRVLVERASGWPFRAFRGSISAEMRAPSAQWPTDEAEAYVGGAILLRPSPRGSSPQEVMLFEYTPIWGGLLGNLAVYFIMWFVVMSGFCHLRRMVRIRRSRCPECAFVLLELSNGCPECGWNRAENEGLESSA